MPEYITKEQAWEVVKIVARHADAHSIALADKALADMPAADVAPVVHGRWVWHGIYGMFSSCSVCGTKFRDRPRVPYCPHCGARMDGDQR